MKRTCILVLMLIMTLGGTTMFGTGCEEEDLLGTTDVDADSDSDGDGIANPIPESHNAYEGLECGNKACHGAGGLEPLPDTDDHDDVTDDDCASCHS